MSKEWIHLFTERLDKKNLSKEDLSLIEDFGESLAIIKSLNADINNPKVEHHLSRAGSIIRHFNEQGEE